MYDICLVNTPVYELEDDRLEPPLGLLYLASYLKDCTNISVKVLDLCGLSDYDIPEAKFFGFSTYSPTYQRTIEIKNKIKEMYPNCKTISGGPHATAMPAEVSKEFDYVVRGEGELSLFYIVSGFLPSGIINGEPFNDLDKLPYPDYDLVDLSTYHRVVDNKKSISILSSRGCPYKCAFCNSIILGRNHNVRFRSPENVYGEITSLLSKYDVNFRFQDDIFGSNIEWLRRFTELISPLNIIYRAFVRSNQCANLEFVKLLKQGGCKHVSIGIESGSDKILKNMNKGQTRDICLKALKNTKEEGIIRRIYLIVGFKGETWDTINETIDFVRISQPDEFVVYPLIPYPGTPLWENPEAFGLRNISKDFKKYFQIYGDKQSHFVYDLDDVDRYELQAMKDYLTSELEKMHISWAINSKGFV